MKIDEYAPLVRPITRARPKSCSEVAPNTNDPTTSTDSTGMIATNEVLIDRARVWFMDRLTMSEYVIRPEAPRPLAFSRIRSNTTTVSYREYPRTVSTAITVSGLTWNPVSE